MLKFNKYQIISILHWAISYKYKFLHISDNELIEFINSVLFSDIYKDLISDNKSKSSFKIAINQKDSKMILKIIKQDNKSNLPVYKNKILRFLFKILN